MSTEAVVVKPNLNGLDNAEVSAKANTTSTTRPSAAEMTSADYYFDSYAHFGEYNLKIYAFLVSRQLIMC